MRIISGNLRGRILSIPKDSTGTRPTSDRVREAIFSVLQGLIDFDQKSVLDLYAGSGALGIEAFSRGATICDFVENDKRVFQVLKENISKLGIDNSSQAFFSAVEKFISIKQYDLVFVDPPYAENKGETLLRDLLKKKIFNSEALLVLECDDKLMLSEMVSVEESSESLRLINKKNYGNTAVWFYKFSKETNGS
jgi:16S rRNA (guanine966-N2)-methyltransferase